MTFSNNDVFDIILKLEHHGKPIRVADCVRFAVRVFTQNRNNFLLFTERDVIKGEHRDRLAIQDYQMKALESGVVVYEYSYSLSDRHFRPFEGHNHDHTKRVVTDAYWTNSNHNQLPSNPVSFQSLNYLRDLIEKEVADRENAIIDLRDYFNESFIDGLRDEIARSTAKDEELEKLIKENKEIADGCVDVLLEKIEGEIKRSNEVDIQLFNKIKEYGENSGATKVETDQKIEETNNDLNDEIDRAKAAERQITNDLTDEVSRAKAAEREINTALNDEVSRAKVKEAELDSKIDSEIARAKVVEGALSDAVDAVRDKANQIASDLASEVSRSNQKDNDHTAALNDEVTRAKASEKAITDRLDVLEGDKDVVGSVKHAVEDAKHYVDDLIGKVTAGELKDLAEVNNALAAEVSRAQTKEAEIDATLAVINGDKEVVGSIANGVESAKKYADEAIATTLSNHNTDLSTLTDNLNSEISRAKASEKALGDRLDTVETVVGNHTAALTDLATADNDLSNAIATETSRAQSKEAEIDAVLAVVNGDEETIGSIKHALDDSKHYTDNQLATLKSQTATDLADALKPYATKEEVDGRIEGIIGTAPAAFDTLGEIADKLAEDSDAIAAINGVLVGKVNKSDVYTKDQADAKHTEISNALSTANTAIQNEVTRAKAAEKVNADAITALSTEVTVVKTTADKTTADLTSEISRAKAAETANANAITALDTKVDGVKTIADKAAADIADLSTEVTGAKSDINGLTNDLASEVSRATTKEAELESGVTANATKIADLTTKESANETAISAVNTALSNEVTRAKGVETDLSNALAAEVSRAQTKEAEIDAKADANASAITALADRTTAVEGEVSTINNDLTAVKNALDVVNGDDTVIGSVAHAEADAKHYCDDEIAKLTAKVEAEVTGFATKSEVAAVDAKVDNLKSKVDAIEAPDAYTKSEVDALIEGVDVSDQLVDYAKTSETTVIKDSDGNIITEMVIDNSDEDDTIEVYTRAQVDEMFASVPQIVTLTQSQYDALTSKANNTLYIVNG